MHEVIIRAAIRSDAVDLLRLIRELAVYERAPDSVTNTVAKMQVEGFGDDSFFEAFIAEQTGKVVGMAIYYWAYSTWRGKYIYLDDLYVEEVARGQGIGAMLLEKVIQYARESEAALVKWQVLDWNAPAISFYEKYDAVMDHEWIDCKLYFNQTNSDSI